MQCTLQCGFRPLIAASYTPSNFLQTTTSQIPSGGRLFPFWKLLSVLCVAASKEPSAPQRPQLKPLPIKRICIDFTLSPYAPRFRKDGWLGASCREFHFFCILQRRAKHIQLPNRAFSAYFGAGAVFHSAPVKRLSND